MQMYTTNTPEILAALDPYDMAEVDAIRARMPAIVDRFNEMDDVFDEHDEAGTMEMLSPQWWELWYEAKEAMHGIYAEERNALFARDWRERRRVQALADATYEASVAARA